MTDKSQSLTKAQKVMMEQAEKIVNSALSQRLAQSHRDAVEQFKRLGLIDEMKRMQELSKLITPPLFQSLNSEQQEEIIEVTEAISEPDTTPEDATKKIEELNNQLMVAHKKVIEQRDKNKALALRNKKITRDEMVIVIDSCRKLNGKGNNEAVGRKLGIDGETAKSWIKKLRLTEYSTNPKHLK